VSYLSNPRIDTVQIEQSDRSQSDLRSDHSNLEIDVTSTLILFATGFRTFLKSSQIFENLFTLQYYELLSLSEHVPSCVSIMPYESILLDGC
jgi:hypothetical protein